YQQLQQARLLLFNRWVIQHPQDKAQRALMQLPLQFSYKKIPFLAPHFVNNVLKDQPKPSKIITTLDYSLQAIIETSARHYLRQNQHSAINNLAVLLLDTRNMEVKALLGSGDFFSANISGQINGTLVKRSPGSSLKPFIYALALDQGLIHPLS